MTDSVADEHLGIDAEEQEAGTSADASEEDVAAVLGSSALDALRSMKATLEAPPSEETEEEAAAEETAEAVAETAEPVVETLEEPEAEPAPEEAVAEADAAEAVETEAVEADEDAEEAPSAVLPPASPYRGFAPPRAGRRGG